MSKEVGPQRLFESAKGLLHKADENGDSLYDTLCEAVLKISQSNSGQVDLLQILQTLKQDSFQINEKRTFEELWNRARSDERTLARSQLLKTLFKQHATDVETINYEKEEKRKKEEAEKAKKSGDDDEEPAEDDAQVTANERYIWSSMNGVSNVVEEAYYFEKGGVGLPSEKLYRIEIALKKLRNDKKLKRVRLFGQINGLDKNYIVAESNHAGPLNDDDYKKLGINPPEEEKPEPPPKKGQKPVKPVIDIHNLPPEPPGVGANKWTYWVCSNPGDEWIRLPDVTPKQITSARHISKYFTGDLKRKINSYPSFPGTEANYLRVQIARIAAATILAPAGLFSAPEPPGDDEEEDAAKKELPDFNASTEYEEIQVADLADQEKWVHLQPYIFGFGRATIYEPPKPETEDGEEPEEGEVDDGGQSKEKEVEKLAPIKSDASIPLPGTRKAPKVKKEGDEDDEEEPAEEPADDDAGDDDGDKKQGMKQIKSYPAWVIRLHNTIHKAHTIAVARSLRWPGAYTFVTENGRRFSNIYVGYGVKFLGSAFTPLLPPPVLDEVSDPVEVKDPTVNNEKRVLGGEAPIDEAADNQPDDNYATGDEDVDPDDE
jgi:radial spoke head protein 4A